MTIDEAIKLQEQLCNLLPEVGFNKYVASVKLSIEALRRWKKHRQTFQAWRYDFLPGETEE